ncbi:MAG: ATP-grasp domain-containing protein [Proteobacteria bacterium]|nr:ATP-grasp domain-containing protein [Pseudomonadota bacterium]MBU1582184.1 ATP-grasp domain-containing protein [Pseudomonadota bacterium]MBU2631974.1 ATP-grasp domain-containing protein [Pseudomonadota bacterium]
MHKKILVIGTTPDYVQWIRLSCPDRALFITAPEIRQAAKEENPAAHEEILIHLSDQDQVFEALKRHLNQWEQAIDAIFCFDCESMELAAFIAGQFNLDYPSIIAIQNCRDKYVSKQIWQHNNIKCPRTAPVISASQAVDFFKTTSSGCVLKPFTGSGSELVFKCTSASDCRSAFSTIHKELKKRNKNPLFQRTSSTEYLMLAEEHISGTEYSCDFIVENNTIRIIRLARKIKSPFKPFGTILGYVLPAVLPQLIDIADLHHILLKSSNTLGINRGLCMVDFIVSDDQVVLIELTPRPGGDCLPHLLRVCTHLDILKISLDFAQKHPVTLPDTKSCSPCVAIRLHAEQAGVLRRIEYRHLLEDKRVKDIFLTKKPGHKIKLPPEDYDSWLLGHIIIEPSVHKFPESQALAISKKIEIFIDENQTKGS